MCASAKKYGKIIFDATKSPTLARLMADCTSFWQNWLLFFLFREYLQMEQPYVGHSSELRYLTFVVNISSVSKRLIIRRLSFSTFLSVILVKKEASNKLTLHGI